MRPQRGQPRELLQAGIELIGSPAPQGTAEALTVLCHALDATGLKDYRIGARRRLAVPRADGQPRGARASARPGCSRRSCGATSSGSSAGSRTPASRGEAAELLLEVPQRRGGPEVLDRHARAGARRPSRACAGCTSCSSRPSPSG